MLNYKVSIADMFFYIKTLLIYSWYWYTQSMGTLAPVVSHSFAYQRSC